MGDVSLLWRCKREVEVELERVGAWGGLERTEAALMWVGEEIGWGWEFNVAA